MDRIPCGSAIYHDNNDIERNVGTAGFFDLLHLYIPAQPVRVGKMISEVSVIANLHNPIWKPEHHSVLTVLLFTSYYFREP